MKQNKPERVIRETHNLLKTYNCIQRKMVLVSRLNSLF